MIAKQLVIFDLVNKFFQQVSLFHMVNMLLYEVLKQRVLLCYGQQLSRNEVGTPRGGKGPQVRLLSLTLHEFLNDGPVGGEILPMGFVA
jgi:hypothetical protein